MGHVWVEQFVKRFQPDFSLAKRRTPAPTVVVDIDHRFAFAGFPVSHRLAVALKQVFTGKWGLLKAQLGPVDPFDASQAFEGLMRTYGKVRWQFFCVDWAGTGCPGQGSEYSVSARGRSPCAMGEKIPKHRPASDLCAP